MKRPVMDIRAGTSDSIVVGEVFDQDTYRFADRKVDGLVLDIGANIGAFSIMAAQKGCSVIAYEPERSNYVQLLRNLKDNHIDSVKTFDLAVGRPGMAYFSDNSGGTRKEEPRQNADRPNVRVVSLDEVVKGPVAFLKMDVEGSEYEIFEECSDATLALIGAFAAEFHPDLTDPLTHDRVIERLAQSFDLEVTGNIPQGSGGIVYGERPC